MRGASFYGLPFRKLVLMLIVGLVISLLQGPLLVRASSDETKVVKVGYYENEIFQEGASEGAVKSGYAYEYYMKLSEYTGWRYEYVYGSYNELYKKLVDGDIDLLAGLAYKEERTESISYPDAAMGNESYILVKHEGDDSINTTLTSINGHTIGVFDSAVADVLESYLNKHNIEASIVRYEDAELLTKAFEDGKIDLLAVEGERTNKREGYEVLLTFGMTDYYICVNKDREDLLSELNAAQSILFNEEPYYRSSLSLKYHSTSVSAQSLSRIEREWLENHDTVTVGYLNSYLPYSDTNSSGKVNGLVKELIPKIFYSIDVDDMKVDYVAYDSYDEMMAGINTGEIDVAFPVGGGVYYSEQNGIYQTEPLISISTDLVYRDVIINPDAATFAINSKNSMQLYYAQTYYPNAKIVYYDSIDECLDAVLKGEVDCTTLNGLRATEILKNYKYNRLSVRQLSERDERCLGVKIGNEGLLRILNRGIHIMDDDYVANISYKYAGDLYKRSFADWLDTYMIFILLVFVAIIILGMLFLLLRIRGLETRITGLINSNKNQMKLIDNIANSIREPVDEIYDISNMAKESISDIDLVNKGLGSIIDKSYDMKAIADKVTEISLLDRGKVELERDKFNIVQLVKGIETEGIQKAERKGLTFKFEVGQIKNKDLIGDKVRTEQILKTVLDNAIKFTPEGGQVSFNVLEQPSKNVSRARIVFTIRDNGVGISEEYKPIVFDAFTKECNEDGKTGVGLGLPIAKRLVDLMNGTIQINSEKNNGCEVVITIDFKISYN